MNIYLGLSGTFFQLTSSFSHIISKLLGTLTLKQSKGVSFSFSLFSFSGN